MSDLKPCPFCGGEASIVSEYSHGEEFEYVECSDCLTRTDSRLHLGVPEEIWNTRHSDPDMVLVPKEPSQKEIGRLRSLIHAMGWNPALFGHSETGLIYEAIVSGTWRSKPLPQPPTAEKEND